MDEKIQKVLARQGCGSRRQMEKVISEGRVTVNGKVAELGDRVTDDDELYLDGKIIKRFVNDKPRVIIYHKPEGEVCTRDDPEGRKTIFDNLPRLKSSRWISIGRLDLNTSGLLLLTTDGELANKLMHPSSEIEREYAVRVLGEVSPEIIEQLKTNVPLDDGDAHFNDVVDAGGQGANHWYHVILKEGRNREVRRLWEYFGFAVSRLMRIRYGDIKLDRRIRPGTWEDLQPAQLNMLYQSVGMTYPQDQTTTSSSYNKQLKRPGNKTTRKKSFSRKK